MVDLADISVLIVSDRRQERRTLFDALDSQEAQAIYTAKSGEQALDFISQMSISLLVVDLHLDPAELKQLLKAFSRQAGHVIAILPEGNNGSFAWDRLSEQVGDAVRSPVDAGEFLFRLNRLLAAANGQPEKARSASIESSVLFDGVDDQYVLTDAKSGEIVAVNPALVDTLGGSAEDWVGRSLDDVGLELSEKRRQSYLRQLRADGSVRYSGWQRISETRVKPVRVSQRLGAQDGQLVNLTALRDTTEIERLRRRLATLARVYPDPAAGPPAATMADLMGEGLKLDYFLVVGADDQPQEKLTVLAAYGRGELNHQLSDPEGHLPYRKVFAGETVLAERDAESVIGRDEFICDNGIQSYAALPLTAADGTVIGALVAARRKPVADWSAAVDILKIVATFFSQEHELRGLRRQHESQGLHDVLTGLPNRMLFNDRLSFALKEAQRTGEQFAMMFVDLDRFKNINDSLGHDVGDQVLLAVADRMRANVRGSDTVARYAGDEFTAILRHIPQKEDVDRICNKINSVLAEPLPLGDGQELQVTASIGVSFYPDDGTNAEQLLKNADRAMYSAKGLGRNTFQTYVDEPEESHQQKLVLESKLRQAQANNELRVFYQPQVSAETEDIVGMEALIRWEHPELGLISPGFFIPLAEETGLIVPMGEWLMGVACAQTKHWQERFGLDLTIGVNLSPLQLRQPDLIEVIEKSLGETDLHPRFLDLEVTESISIKTIPGLREKLQSLRDMGCRISIDDFGTGQSSLDYLKRFPADRIKIDQSFVRNIGVDPDDEAIVHGTISMAHELKMEVVAEGVEEENHLEFLIKHGCDQLQGFLFCRPLPADSFSRLLLDREALTAAG